MIIDAEEESAPESGIRDSDRAIALGPRDVAIARCGHRWSASALAAAYALPDSMRGTPEDWAELIDDLEAGVSAALRP